MVQTKTVDVLGIHYIRVLSPRLFFPVDLMYPDHPSEVHHLTFLAKTADPITVSTSGVTGAVGVGEASTKVENVQDMRLSTLTEGLKGISKALKSSVESSSALGGAVLGLRGSPAYHQMVRDSMHATGLLSNSIKKISSIEKDVNKLFSKDSIAESGIGVPLFFPSNTRRLIIDNFL